MPYERELQVALEAAARSSRRILELYESFVAIPNAPVDISTEADRDSQELILQTLHHQFADDSYCAEEQTPTLAACRRAGTRRIWIIDPIDGSRGFAQKNGEFSVMIGLAEEGRVVLGVILEPAAGRLTYAVRGGGCWSQDRQDDAPVACQVSTRRELAECTLTQSRSRVPTQPSRQALALGPARVIETHSAGVKLAKVARGEADIYVNHYPNFSDWDICAGHVLVEEAGGVVTGLKGQAIRYGEPGAHQRLGLVASNGLLHDPALVRLRDVF